MLFAQAAPQALVEVPPHVRATGAFVLRLVPALAAVEALDHGANTAPGTGRPVSPYRVIFRRPASSRRSQLASFTRGRPRGCPAARSAASIACQPSCST